jgi:hypothetical protein
MKIYIARDGEQDGENQFELYLHFNKPVWKDGIGWDSQDYMSLETDSFPEIKNGECYEFEIKDGRKI